MTTNPYFNSNYNSLNHDQKLVNDLIIESIKIYGIDVSYIPRFFVNFDQLLGEDQSSKFTEYYDIEMYVKNVDGFGGDGTFVSQFGYEIRDEVVLSVSRTRWKELSSSLPTPSTGSPSILGPRPLEGDLIRLPTVVDKAGRLFEIYHVNREEVYYQLGNLYTYELKCRAWEQAGETFDTGNINIDSYNDFISTSSYRLTNGFGNFIIGEKVIVENSSPEISAIVVSWDQPTRTIELKNLVNGDLNSTMTLVGQNSNAEFDIVSLIDIITQIQSDSDNDGIENEAIQIVDFDEKNPFSS